MNPQQTITILVLIQIFLLVGSFGILSHFENEQSIFEKSVIIITDTKHISANLVHETEKFLAGVPYSSPDELIQRIDFNMATIRHGGFLDDATHLNPLPEKFLPLCKIAEEKLEVYITHVNEIKIIQDFNLDYNNPEFLVLETERFDAEGAFNVLINSMIKENNYLTSFIFSLNYVLAIFNVAIHVVMIFSILNILKKQKQKELKLEKFSVIGELSARLAHDLLNPLNVLHGVFELLKYSKDRKMSSSHEDRAFRAIHHMSHQILDVMNYIKTMEISRSDILISKLIDNAMKRIPDPESVKIEKPENDFKISCDVLKIEVVLSNLISNSIDAVDSKGTIKIFAKDSIDNIQIRIEDSGPGIPEDIINEIFEPLVTSKQKGTGLGLASCKSIIDAHGGILSARNNPTTFTIILPKNLEKS